MPKFAITTYKRHESDLDTRGPNCWAGSAGLSRGYKKIPERRRVALVGAEGARWDIFRGMARRGLSGGCPFGRTEEAEVAKLQCSTEDRMDTDKNAPRLGATPVVALRYASCLSAIITLVFE